MKHDLIYLKGPLGEQNVITNANCAGLWILATHLNSGQGSFLPLQLYTVIVICIASSLTKLYMQEV